MQSRTLIFRPLTGGCGLQSPRHYSVENMGQAFREPKGFQGPRLCQGHRIKNVEIDAVTSKVDPIV